MNGNGYTGRTFEEEILLRCLWVWNGYVSYHKSMVMVKEFQPWDPTDPSSPAANDLHTLVVEALGIEDYSAVKLYTAVSSPLDVFHGIDCFVEWEGIVVTIDLTANCKKDSYKADLVIHEDNVYTEDGRVNQLQLQRIGQEIARLLRCRVAATSRCA